MVPDASGAPPVEVPAAGSGEFVTAGGGTGAVGQRADLPLPGRHRERLRRAARRVRGRRRAHPRRTARLDGGPALGLPAGLRRPVRPDHPPGHAGHHRQTLRPGRRGDPRRGLVPGRAQRRHQPEAVAPRRAPLLRRAGGLPAHGGQPRGRPLPRARARQMWTVRQPGTGDAAADVRAGGLRAQRMALSRISETTSPARPRRNPRWPNGHISFGYVGSWTCNPAAYRRAS